MRKVIIEQHVPMLTFGTWKAQKERKTSAISTEEVRNYGS